ncbi:Nif3-like dinuclear metal center hexameric protein [Vandammella animalimorsus]|uniref:GTP cyclohydrolase 1 type 2 homolog n=1 Tax=Vandammella animalimorsus TaxID=2029117 RepID=A0A2A2T4J7_9BURK|nr:Nif3-like dinuclear metal center hexameric protein [Vandammella animalimorsus]PAX16429.1 Nif3-like dinuclear metal center hexameric protein [Vandammella animalimorsus]PAX18844.1 Nif3-like dinuclear metal center hexameric protein [Vandammella animalimorsus]
MTVSRDRLLDAFAQVLDPDAFDDYGPNGLQVEGKPQIGKIVSGVTASAAFIDAAIAAGADAIVVHHGLFWRGMDGTVTGWMKQRLQRLLAHDINVLAYHLPLDAHPEWGNNAQLGLHMGWGAGAPLREKSLVFCADLATPYANGQALADQLQHRLGRTPICIDAGRSIRTLAWCTGGAQGYFQKAIDAGVDAFVTGEISEPQAHLARECGVSFIAAGHHATERYGMPALAGHIAGQLGLEHEFIEIDNPA